MRYLDQIASIMDAEIAVPCETEHGLFLVSAFRIQCGKQTNEFASIHLGDLSQDEPEGVPVRIHSGCVTGEVFGDLRCDCAWQLKHALEFIVSTSKGVVIYVPHHEGRGHGLVQKIKSFRLMNAGMSSVDAFIQMGIPLDARDYAPAVVILQRLGVQKVRLITNNPAKLDVVRQFGIDVIDRIPSVVNTTDPRLLAYLESKKRQLGHLIEVPL